MLNLFPTNLQFFADGEPTNTDPATQQQGDTTNSLAELLAQFQQSQQQNAGGTQPTQNTEPTGQEPATDNTEPNTEPQVDAQQQKDARAFATMRVQNKSYKDALEKIAHANNIQYTDIEDLLTKLNDDAVTKQAQAQGVPVEIARRLDMLERQNAQFEAQRRQNMLTQQFTVIKQKYNLDDNALMSFAQQLSESGIDPTTPSFNMEAEYITRNFDAIVQAKMQAAVEAALRKDTQAGTQGTQPNAAQGSATGGQMQYNINTRAGLEQLLAQMPQI